MYQLCAFGKKHTTIGATLGKAGAAQLRGVRVGLPAQGVKVKPQLATASQGGVKQRTTTVAGKALNGVQVGASGHLHTSKDDFEFDC